MKKFLCLIISLIILASTFVSCGNKTVEFNEIDFRTVSDISKVSTTDEQTDYVLLDVKDYGQILIRLFPDVAPKTVKNFKSLVAEGFYDVHKITISYDPIKLIHRARKRGLSCWKAVLY